MKKINLQNAIRDLRRTGLTHDEKKDMLARIMQKPVSIPVESPFFKRSHFATFFPMKMAYAMAVLFLVVGGVSTSYAAEKSVPGDALYPIKIRVNEQIKGVLAVKKEAKIEWEAEKAGRRIAEARELASQGRLDEAARKNVETHFNIHAEKFSQISNEEKKDGKGMRDKEKSGDQLRDKFEAGIAAETDKLEIIKESSVGVQKHEIQELENTIKEKMQKVKKDKKK